MRTRLLILFVLLVFAGSARATEPPLVAFYETLRCAAPPVVDGRLDDACWQGLPELAPFYQYWKPMPQAPPLKTAARLCYDDRALYMGVTMYEDQFDKIKASITARDDPQTWMDDCVEIIVDPANSGTGYLKFCTNYLAARYDEKATNMVLDSGWNVEGWQVKTSRGTAGGESAWFIEFALPWTDLDQKPRVGDIWAFDLVRYGYSSGGFRGVTWSLGGAGAQPGKLGYLGFGPFSPYTAPALRRLGPALAKVKGPRFRLLQSDFTLLHDRGRWQRESLGDWLTAALSPASDELAQAREALHALPEGADRQRLEKTVDEVAARLAELTAQAATPALATAPFVHGEGLALRRQAAEAKWEAKLLGLVSSP